MSEPLRVLCVCTHNRTRSVMTGALLQRHLVRLQVPATVSSAGTQPGGYPAIDGAVRLLAGRGIDVRDHRSRLLTDDIVLGSDLIVTAERAHVVAIAGRWPSAFSTTFTLPEIVALAGDSRRDGASVADWVLGLGGDRPVGLDYLDAHTVEEIEDPTGRQPAVWDRVFAQIDALTNDLATALR
jgi:protein-tyrosine phosphatase